LCLVLEQNVPDSCTLKTGLGMHMPFDPSGHILMFYTLYYTMWLSLGWFGGHLHFLGFP
jgi:hypothetical protein